MKILIHLVLFIEKKTRKFSCKVLRKLYSEHTWLCTKHHSFLHWLIQTGNTFHTMLNNYLAILKKILNRERNLCWEMWSCSWAIGIVNEGPWVDFINVLHKAFTLVDPKSVKIDNLTVFFVLSRSMWKRQRIKCWWHLAPGSISPTCICAAFTHADPKG